MKGFSDDVQALKDRLDAVNAEHEKNMEEHRKQMQTMADEMAWFKLVIVADNVANGVTSRDSEEYKDILTQMETIRRYFNNGNKVQATHERFLEILAKTDMFEFLPIPTEQDAGYASFYHTLRIIRSKSLLAHRFDIAGRAQQDGIGFELHGGYQNVMVPEMSSSFEQYIGKNRNRIVDAIMQEKELAIFGKQALQKLLDDVGSDVKQVILDQDITLVGEKAKSANVMLLAPSLKVDESDMWHAISVSFINDICLIGDKARDKDPGIDIFQLTGNAEEILQAKEKGGSEIVQTRNVVSPDSPLTTTDMFTTDLAKKLKMKKIGHLPLQPQYGENCTWSSCAKCLLLEALYCRFYQAAIAQNVAPKQARELAQKAARMVQKDWVREDKFEYLKSYVTQHSDVDPVLLAYIKLKYQHRPKSQHIVHFIDNLGIVKEQHLKAAKEMAYKRAEIMLQEEFPMLYKFFPQKINEISRKFAELYLLTNKATVEKVYNSISFLSFSPFQNVMSTLDKAINVAHETHVKRGSPVLVAASLSSSGVTRQVEAPQDIDGLKKAGPSKKSRT